jgi:hypothetical protein
MCSLKCLKNNVSNNEIIKKNPRRIQIFGSQKLINSLRKLCNICLAHLPSFRIMQSCFTIIQYLSSHYQPHINQIDLYCSLRKTHLNKHLSPIHGNMRNIWEIYLDLWVACAFWINKIALCPFTTHGPH